MLTMLAGAMLPPAASGALAQTKAQAPHWVCAGYLEKRLDRDVASPGIRVYRERYLVRKDGAVRRAVFVFPVAFRIMRDHLRSQSATRFGESAYGEHPALDLARDVPGTQNGGEKQAGAYAPGDQIAAAPGISLKSAAAVRIASKPYNGVPSTNGWSELNMVVLDGASIVGMDSTLIVLWREDSHEEWGTGPTGRLLDFGKHRVGETFVTSSEFALMERLAKLYDTPFGLYPLAGIGPLQMETQAWRDARSWLERYQEKPDKSLQTPPPGRC